MKYPAREWPRCARCQKPGHPDRRVEHEGKVYCSSSCVESLQEELAQGTLRARVEERDKGKCALCPVNAIVLREEIDGLKRDAEDCPFGGETYRRVLNVYEARVAQLVHVGFDRDAVENGKALWQADHVEPRVRGGPSTLENARTLCLSCHKKVTSELARERAESRRPRRFGR